MTTATVTWIACSERLPDDDRTLLIYAPPFGVPVVTGWHNGCEWVAIDGYPFPAGTVTHWADLPEPPKETGNG